MIYRYKFLPLAALLVAATACEDMDTVPEGSFVTASQKSDVYANDASKTSASVDGAFLAMSAYEPNYSSLGSYHSDFGYPSVMIFTDCNGEDVVGNKTKYNWFSNEIQFSDRSITSAASQMIWQNLYSYIFSANSIVASMDAASESPQILLSLAQGHALRAFSYFQLAQLYQFNYVGHESSPCVPIITDENSADVAANGAKRSTVQEVYDLIYADLDKAVDLLSQARKGGSVRSGKHLVDLATAYGLRARVNLVTRNWASALADAEAAIEFSPALPSSIADASRPAFSSLDEGDWMWGIDVSETDDVVASNIINWISHMGTLNYGYGLVSGGLRISAKLFNSIADTDVRKGWWLSEDGEACHMSGGQKVDHFSADDQSAWVGYTGYTIGEYYAPYTTVKFGPYNGVVATSTNANDLPLMRIEEMYLIKAEAECMTGGDARGTLTSFVKTYRDPEYVFDGDDLHEEIWRQRRVELWGEGVSWFDIMRLGVGFDRRGAGFQKDYVFVMNGDDTKLLWPIPQSEVEANPALSTDDYNPTSPTPKPVADDANASVADERIDF